VADSAENGLIHRGATLRTNASYIRVVEAPVIMLGRNLVTCDWSARFLLTLPLCCPHS
jgi:hypothetical protein